MKITKRELGRIIREEVMRLTEAPRKPARQTPVAKRLPANVARPMPGGGRPAAGVMGSPDGVRRQIIGAASSGMLHDKTIERQLRAAVKKAFPDAKPGDLNMIMNVANNACAIKIDIEQTQSEDFSYQQDEDELSQIEELESELDDEIEKLHGLFDQLIGTGDFAPKTKPSGQRGKSGRSAARR